MHTDGVAHGPPRSFMHTGSINLIRPSVGSWVLYGLGSENQNLPGFISLQPSMGNGGPRNYSSAFLPAVYQGTAVGRAGGLAKDARIQNLRNPLMSVHEQQAQFELLRGINQAQLEQRPGESELEAVLSSYELAWRMQQHAPDALDISREQIISADSTAWANRIRMPLASSVSWLGDWQRRACGLCRSTMAIIRTIRGGSAFNLPKHAEHARNTDKPVAGLLADLKQRGLLEDTLLWWGGEFGRTPYAQDNGTGRDHNPNGFTIFLAGGGVKSGFRYGATDEYGHHAIQNKVHMHDFHATLLHLLGNGSRAADLPARRTSVSFDRRPWSGST